MTDDIPPPTVAGRRPSSDRQRPSADDPVVQYVVSEGFPLETAIEMIYVQGHASNVADAAQALLGERFGEVRIEHDGHILVTVIDLTEADDSALRAIAQQCGIDCWIKTRRADPAALIAWEQVRQELVRLQDASPTVLLGWPTPQPGYRHPPFRINLTAHGADVAAALHERFGAFVELRVGALAYPLPAERAAAPQHDDNPPVAGVDPAEIHIELDGPLTIASGHTASHGLMLTNLTDTAITVNTNGHLTPQIADPDSGRIVGGYAGAQISPLVRFALPPAQPVRIPLHVGTASYDPDIGYAIPPGEWALLATLNLTDGRVLNTPLLPITITD